MKNLTQLFLLSLLLITAACKKTEQQKIAQPGQVKFGMVNTTKVGSATEKVLSPIPEAIPAFVLLSITDAQGQAMETDKKIALYAFGGSFVSESLSLKPGNYKLSKFLVLDATNKIIYASPLSGSAQAQYVNNPLPLGFSITENGSTLVTPQVVKVETNTPPESFGYVSFGFEVVTTAKPKLKEIWQDGPYANYKTYYSYSGDLPVKETLYYYYNNIWNLLDSTVFHYNNSGKLSEGISYKVFNPAPPITTSYEYSSNGLLKKMWYTGDLNSNSYEWEFYYDLNNKPVYAEQRIKSSNAYHLQYRWEYTSNSQDDITSISYYTISNIGKTLKFKFDYTYDQALNLSFTRPDRYAPTGQKHNIISQQTTGYNLSNGGLVTSYSCMFTRSYQYNASGLPITGKISNPDSCFEENFDGTKFTYIYQ